MFFSLLIMLEKCTSLICLMLLFISRELSTIGAESSEDALAAAETEIVGLADWKSARPTWAVAGAVGLADLGKAAEVVGLADSGQAAIGSSDFEVSSADSEQTGSPPLLLVGA